MSEESKALVRRFIEEIWNAGNLDIVDELVHPDFVEYGPAGQQTCGPGGVRRFVEAYRAAFPGLHMSVEDQIAEGDKVATRWTARATHRGELMGVSASGNRVEVRAISVDRISGGKFAKSWTIYDALGMMQRIDAIPLPEQPSPTCTPEKALEMYPRNADPPCSVWVGPHKGARWTPIRLAQGIRRKEVLMTTNGILCFYGGRF